MLSVYFPRTFPPPSSSSVKFLPIPGASLPLNCDSGHHLKLESCPSPLCVNSICPRFYQLRFHFLKKSFLTILVQRGQPLPPLCSEHRAKKKDSTYKVFGLYGESLQQICWMNKHMGACLVTIILAASGTLTGPGYTAYVDHMGSSAPVSSSGSMVWQPQWIFSHSWKKIASVIKRTPRRYGSGHFLHSSCSPLRISWNFYPVKEWSLQVTMTLELPCHLHPFPDQLLSPYGKTHKTGIGTWAFV